MTELLRVAAELQAFCEQNGWRFCLIGGLALQHWGEPRETVGVDLTLLTGFGGEEPFIECLLSRFSGRIDDAAGFARSRRVLLLRSKTGVGIDIALAGLPFEAGVVDRSWTLPFPGGVSLRICSAEDLVVLKAFASRPRDWVDIEGVIARQGRQAGLGPHPRGAGATRRTEGSPRDPRGAGQAPSQIRTLRAPGNQSLFARSRNQPRGNTARGSSSGNRPGNALH